MKFLIDRCAGGRLAVWLRDKGHDVTEARELGADPGDRALLGRAAAEGRILVTIDTDFGKPAYASDAPHAGIVRLPDAPAERRVVLMAKALDRHRGALEKGAVVTVSEERIRVSAGLSVAPPPA